VCAAILACQQWHLLRMAAIVGLVGKRSNPHGEMW
jgi:hypothetical protein